MTSTLTLDSYAGNTNTIKPLDRAVTASSLLSCNQMC